MTMTPGVQVLLRVPANHLARLVSAFEQFISLPAILTGARGRVARGGHLSVITTEVVFAPRFSRMKVLAVSRQVRAAHDLPLLMS